MRNLKPLLILIALARMASCLSYKIGNSLNQKLQTGEASLFTSPLSVNATSYFTVAFPTSMPTNYLEAAVGVVATSFVIEVPQGWMLYVEQVNSSQMVVKAWSHYPVDSPSSMVYNMKVRFMVSCHPYVDIDYGSYNFSSNSALTQVPIAWLTPTQPAPVASTSAAARTLWSLPTARPSRHPTTSREWPSWPAMRCSTCRWTRK